MSTRNRTTVTALHPKEPAPNLARHIEDTRQILFDADSIVQISAQVSNCAEIDPHAIERALGIAHKMLERAINRLEEVCRGEE